MMPRRNNNGAIEPSRRLSRCSHARGSGAADGAARHCRGRPAQPGEHVDFADVRRRLRAIFIGSIGNLVEWYDFYAYAAFTLYFAKAFFPEGDEVVQQLTAAVLFADDFSAVRLGVIK